jgi:hypothetical protein
MMETAELQNVAFQRNRNTDEPKNVPVRSIIFLIRWVRHYDELTYIDHTDICYSVHKEITYSLILIALSLQLATTI